MAEEDELKEHTDRVRVRRVIEVANRRQLERGEQRSRRTIERCMSRMTTRYARSGYRWVNRTDPLVVIGPTASLTDGGPDLFIRNRSAYVIRGTLERAGP